MNPVGMKKPKRNKRTSDNRAQGQRQRQWKSRDKKKQTAIAKKVSRKLRNININPRRWTIVVSDRLVVRFEYVDAGIIVLGVPDVRTNGGTGRSRQVGLREGRMRQGGACHWTVQVSVSISLQPVSASLPWLPHRVSFCSRPSSPLYPSGYPISRIIALPNKHTHATPSPPCVFSDPGHTSWPSPGPGVGSPPSPTPGTPSGLVHSSCSKST